MTLLTQNPKLAPDADYFELIKALKKVKSFRRTFNIRFNWYCLQIIAKDSNIPVVLVAAKDLALLAKGLRKGFKTHAVGVRIFCSPDETNQTFVDI